MLMVLSLLQKLLRCLIGPTRVSKVETTHRG
jgi:hypothetical protein